MGQITSSNLCNADVEDEPKLLVVVSATGKVSRAVEKYGFIAVKRPKIEIYTALLTETRRWSTEQSHY